VVVVDAVITVVQAWIPEVFVIRVIFHSCKLHYSFVIHAHNKKVIQVTATYKSKSHLCPSTSRGLSVYFLTIKVSSRGTWSG